MLYWTITFWFVGFQARLILLTLYYSDTNTCVQRNQQTKNTNMKQTNTTIIAASTIQRILVTYNTYARTHVHTHTFWLKHNFHSSMRNKNIRIGMNLSETHTMPKKTCFCPLISDDSTRFSIIFTQNMSIVFTQTAGENEFYSKCCVLRRMYWYDSSDGYDSFLHFRSIHTGEKRYRQNTNSLNCSQSMFIAKFIQFPLETIQIVLLNNR